MRLATALTIIFAAAVGGCSLPDTDSFRGFDMSGFKPRTTGAMRENFVRPIGPEDLADASGSCPALASEAPPTAEPVSAQPGVPPAGTPLLAGGVALQMTECDVVRRVGTPERVELGQNERSERTATMTYTGGSRPGVYQFTAGRLTAIERGPEPVAPARPQRTQRPAAKKKSAT